MADLYRKSIDYYTFLGGPEFSSFIEQPDKKKKSGENRKKTHFKGDTGMRFQTVFTDISNEDLNMFEHSGRFRWEAHQQRAGADAKLGGEYWEISPLTGSMQVDKYPDSPTDMMRQTSRTNQHQNWAYSYGFYDSGAGFGELTNHDQSYVYVTPDVSNWMGTLTQRDPKYADAPFRTFILPGSHDAGTYDLTVLKKVANNQVFQNLLLRHIGNFATGKVTAFSLELAQNFAVTQKDDVKSQLELGARYFDFRPGACTTELLVKGYYHQHAVVPGVSYVTFLQDIADWLAVHPTEIAVVRVGFDGFVSVIGKPSPQELDNMLKSINRRGTVEIGDHRDFGTSYNDLIKSGKRMLVVYAPETNMPVTAKKYDSYNAQTYETTDSSKIAGALSGMTKAGQSGYDYTVLQLQGTASAVGIAGTAFNASKSGSPLMSTKAQFDSQNYPWVRNNVRKNLGDGQLIVLLNDFVDNALAMHAMKAMSPDKF